MCNTLAIILVGISVNYQSQGEFPLFNEWLKRIECGGRCCIHTAPSCTALADVFWMMCAGNRAWLPSSLDLNGIFFINCPSFSFQYSGVLSPPAREPTHVKVLFFLFPHFTGYLTHHYLPTWDMHSRRWVAIQMYKDGMKGLSHLLCCKNTRFDWFTQ